LRGAIVTGATSGIGRATAIALAQEGYWVLASGRDPSRGKEVVERILERGRGGFFGGDLAGDGVPEEMVERVVAEAGRLELVVNNAAVHFLATIDRTDTAELDRLMAVNLRAAMLLCRAAIPAMRGSGGGVVINVSSEAGLVAVPGQIAYNVSKAALVMLTKSIAADHASDGIRAVTICPGTTRTPLVEAAIATADDPSAHERWLSSSRPSNRLGSEEEIARTIIFAASDAVAFMTGSEIVVDGGYTAV
jgi:NAD(P)-dependent dehydrogenase (short-subunit alcohol dehydrogenase family)